MIQTIFIYSIYFLYAIFFIVFIKRIPELITSNKFNLSRSFIWVFLVSIVLFFLLLLFNSGMSDIPTHMRGAIRIANVERISGHFLFFLIVAILSFFSTNEYVLIFITIIVLSIAQAYKYKLSYIYNYYINSAETNFNIFKIGAIISIFSFPLIIYPFYPRIMDSPLNVWYNATTIFLMPFALLLFFKSYEYLQGKNCNKIIWILIFLVFLNIIAKPSFFFVFCIVFPIFSLLQYKFNKYFWKSLIPVCFGLLILGLQYLYIYVYLSKIGSSTSGEESGVAIKPFFYFYELNNILYVIIRTLFNYTFPIFCSIFYFDKIKKNKIVLYSISLLLAALFIKYSIYETGPRAGHGNFGWQVVVSGYIWFLVCVQVFFSEITIKPKLLKKDIFLIFILGLHIVSFFIWFVLWSFFKMW
jgi:hypothetical protein